MRFPKNLEKIGSFAFYENSLEHIELPASLRVIADGTFSHCENLSIVQFGEGLEALGTDKHPADYEQPHGVSQGNSSETAKLPLALERIGCYAFGGCKNLKGINLPDSLERVGKQCFQESGLRSVHLPIALREIDDNAFRQCKELKEVTFPNGLESIGQSAFF